MGLVFLKTLSVMYLNSLYVAEHTKKDAAGIGLFIVNGSAKALGGSVKVSNKTEGGAKFVVTLPAD